MAEGGDGFVGRCEVVEPRRRGKRRWSNEMKARMVVESLQPGVRVVDMAARYDILPHHLSAGRRHARQCQPTLPGDLTDLLTTVPSSALAEPAFVPLSILPDPVDQPVPSTAVAAQGGFRDDYDRGRARSTAAHSRRCWGGTRGRAGAGPARCAVIVAGQRLPILIATRPVDFRCGHQALALIVQTQLKLDPHSGVTVVYRSKRGDQLKILVCCAIACRATDETWAKTNIGTCQRL